MKTIILSVAHAPQSPGAEYRGITEYSIAQPLSTLIEQECVRRGLEIIVLDVGGESPSDSYKAIKYRKARAINKIAESTECFCVETHLQKGSGTGTLFYAGSREGERIARKVQPEVSRLIGKGVHYHGAFGVPDGRYYDNPGYAPYFLKLTKPPAIIIELGSITLGEWWLENASYVARAVASGFERALRS